LLLRCGDRAALRRRERGGLLGGMWEFPNLDGALTARAAADALFKWGISPVRIYRGPDKKHVFTHIEWAMKSYIVEVDAESGPFVWMTERQFVKDIALPAAFKSFTHALFKSE